MALNAYALQNRQDPPVCREHELILLCGMGSGHVLSIFLGIYNEDPVEPELSKAYFTSRQLANSVLNLEASLAYGS